MGLKMEGGGRRSQASGFSVVIPRCCPGSPFKGHLSTKSNAFCLDSSRNLGGQYLIRDHMVVHYDRILSAKAAVDCSMPKSRLASIKFADQQRREKLKKKLGKCEEKMSICETVSRSCSRDNGRLLPSSFRKEIAEDSGQVLIILQNPHSTLFYSCFCDFCWHSVHCHFLSFLEVEGNLCPCAAQAQYRSRAPSPCVEHGLVRCTPVKRSRKCSRNASRASHASVCTSRPPSKHSGLTCCHSLDNIVRVGCSPTCQGKNPKANSADLLERHSECFTKTRKPFTPRTLISNAKSLLTEYRYYTPARRRKKNRRKHRVEVQTQTDMISFPSGDKVYVRKVMCEHQKIPSKAEAERCTPDEPEIGIDDCQCSIQRETSQHCQNSSPRNVEAEEEELLYLTFIEDVTNEILRLGLFSNRVLDQLFECYIEENKNRLDEGKMRQMLDVLKSDLGCGHDSETELIHGCHGSETELTHGCHGSETELTHGCHGSETELTHGCHGSETELSCAGHDSETELTHGCHGSETELSCAGHDSETELTHGCHGSETELSHAGHDSDTELSCAGLDSETELIRARLDNKTKLIRAGLDSKTKLIRAGLDRKTKPVCGGLDSKTKLIHEDLDSETELIRARLDSKTKLIRAGLDSKTKPVCGGLDSKTKLIHEDLDSETELIQASQEASEPLDLQESDTTEELEFTGKGHRLRKATKSEESRKTVSFLEEPSKCESLSCSERSRETQSREDFSDGTTEMMDAGTESDSCDVEYEEHSDTSPTCGAALNLIACDSDLEVNKKLDALGENLADTLHISRNYS